MKATILDNLFHTCLANKTVMPLYQYLDQILHQTTPICLAWTEKNPLQQHLPNRELVWPHSGFCVDVNPEGITKGRYALCIDQGYSGPELAGWCENFRWQLDGLLLFQRNERHFEVIPLAVAESNRGIVMPEIQLAFHYGPDGWAFEKSKLGPINATFHEVHIRRMDAEGQSGVDDSIEFLGNVVSLCLGTLYAKLTSTAQYIMHPAKPAKLKMKGERVVKIYKQATVGHLEIR